MDNKQELLQRVLSDLYHVFRYENCRRMDQALSTVLEAMEKHPTQKHIQISGRYRTPSYQPIVYNIERGQLRESSLNFTRVCVDVLLQRYVILHTESEREG